jgi:hypothetical protein
MFKKLQAPAIALVGAALLAGCAEDSSLFSGTSNLTTASISDSQKADPACISLASQIDTLKKEGVADKVAQASIKKYKLTPADLTKADQLNRSNAEFQAKCSSVKPGAAAQTASAAPAGAAGPAATAPKKIAPAVANPFPDY